MLRKRPKINFSLDVALYHISAYILTYGWYVAWLADPRPFHGYVHLYRSVSGTSTRYLAHPFDIIVNSAYALLTTICNYNLTNTRKPSLLVYSAPAPIILIFGSGIVWSFVFSRRLCALSQVWCSCHLSSWSP